MHGAAECRLLPCASQKGLPANCMPGCVHALQTDLRRAMASQAAQRAKQEGGHLMTAAVRRAAWALLGGQGCVAWHA